MSSNESSSLMSRTLRLYDDQPPGIRAFVRARHLLCPLSAVEQRVPREGRILDLGCGHGLFSGLMALASARRTILGIDPSPAKIAVASHLAARLPEARFVQGTIDDVQDGDLDAITIVDVLYLLPMEEKLKILRRCRELLKPEGRLILKTNDTHPAWKYQWAKFQEMAMTSIGLTLGHGSLHFISCAQHVVLMKEAGFREQEVVHLPTWLPYPHTLFVGFP